MSFRRFTPLAVSAAVTMTLAAGQAFAEDFPLLPPAAKPGECYTRIYVPPQYETKVEERVVADGTEHVEIVPTEFKWVEKEVLVKEEAEKIEVIPASFKTVTEQVVVTPETEELEIIPAEYETVEEKVLIREGYTTWKTGRGPIEKIDASTGEIMCLVEVPAKYKTIEKRVLKTPVTIKKVEIPAEYKTVKVKKLVKPAQEQRAAIDAEHQEVEKRIRVSDARISWEPDGAAGDGKVTGKTLCLAEVPAKYKTITKQVIKSKATVDKVAVPSEIKTMRMSKLVAPASEKRIPIPAKHQIVPKRSKVSDARQEWRPVLCETNTTKDLVLQIQQALESAGFNPGVVDGVLGNATMQAIDAYQREHNLPTGGLTLQTIEKLGIKAGS